jgi:hypothetical protein
MNTAAAPIPSPMHMEVTRTCARWSVIQAEVRLYASLPFPRGVQALLDLLQSGVRLSRVETQKVVSVSGQVQRTRQTYLEGDPGQ